MTTWDVCRHGLLTYERDGITLHRHDGTRCERMPAETTEPTLLAYERSAAPAHELDASGTPAPQPVEPPTTTLLASAPLDEMPVDAEPAPRHSRRGLVAGGVALVALLFLGAGVGIGMRARGSAVNRQRHRAAVAEEQVGSLRGEISSKQATIADQQRQLASAREEQDRLRRQNTQLAEATPTSVPAGAQATSFGDGLFQADVAIQPGEYRTDGSDACYWAKLSTGDTNSVITSEFVTGPQTVTIDSPYFESENCGTWTKVS